MDYKDRQYLYKWYVIHLQHKQEQLTTYIYLQEQAFIETHMVMYVQNSAFAEKEFCFSYSLAYLTDGSLPTKKIDDKNKFSNRPPRYHLI
jgi:hypothetical protein